jgi:transglutaminase-like putative cysteine protease
MMGFEIAHVLRYEYDEPVTLEPHLIRLYPRAGASCQVHGYSLAITPTPAGQTLSYDLEGNGVHEVWFEGPTTELVLRASMRVSVTPFNPLKFILLPVQNTRLPLQYRPEEQRILLPYLQGAEVPRGVINFAQRVRDESGVEVVPFLLHLSRRISESCVRVRGASVPALTPEATLEGGRGTCLDLAVLFMEACRAMGLAARFVSGYALNEGRSEDFALHAWAEVYLPGAGWRGFDPSQGGAAAERHVVLAASATAEGAAPVSGTYLGSPGASRLASHLWFQKKEIVAA